MALLPSGCSAGGAPLVGGEEKDASTGSDVTAIPDATSAEAEAQPEGCTSNGDCATATTGHVCLAGACVLCGADADCPTGERCNTHTSCVACLTSADCSADQRCVAGACAQGCDAASTCPTGTVCDVATSACVGCLLDTDCAAPTPRCNTTNLACIGCLTTGDCAAGTVCNANACVPGCTSTQPCPAGEVCNAGACVQCLLNSQCHGATPWCDTTSDQCAQCLPSNDNCPAGEYCAGTACAPGCRTNLDCAVLADAGSDASPDAGVGAGADAADEGEGGSDEGGSDAATDAAADGATEGGSGIHGGAVCDAPNHVCVGCVTDSNCPLGQTCSGNQCVTGCDAQHGCPAGSGCCSNLCQPLNTTSNCTACGATCDTTSGNSQGAACTVAGCTYTGCAAGWGDCSAAAPDGDGCETNLTTSGEKVCSDGRCVASATCCSALDCTTAPAPEACYPARGTCAAEGATCNYAAKPGAVICNGTTCCNPIEGTCNPDCSLTCDTGFGHCSADPSDGCESNLTTCVNTPCCAAGLCNPHQDGQGQPYTDCTDPAGTPGSGATYNGTMADDAAKAWAAAGTVAPRTCSGQSCVQNVSGGQCVVWCYTGALGGYERLSLTTTCACPTTASGTWE